MKIIVEIQILPCIYKKNFFNISDILIWKECEETDLFIHCVWGTKSYILKVENEGKGKIHTGLFSSKKENKLYKYNLNYTK